mmetsp:Transcript_34358/g.75157  ORF Transcript_34358/g.75157 Transcript_34358/m.75157 type:complete len:219 (+) Transcript_34358:130-786(+)
MGASGSPSLARVVLFGCGGVGQALLRQIVRLHKTHKSCVPVFAVCDSKFMLTATNDIKALDNELLERIVSIKQEGTSLDALASAEGVTVQPADMGLEGIMADAVHRAILVDCTASEATGTTLATWAEKGGAVVLANKKPTTGHMALFNRLTVNPAKFRCESTCGAGMPIMAAVGRIVRSGDTIHKISGAFSGTLGFVMSGLEAGKSFSAVVTEAKALG